VTFQPTYRNVVVFQPPEETSLSGISRQTVLHFALAVACGAVLTCAAIFGTELLTPLGLRQCGDLFVVRADLVTGVVAITGIVLAWRVHRRDLTVALTKAREHAVAVETARTELERLVTGLPVAVYQGVLRPNGYFKREYLTSSVSRVTGWAAEQIPDFEAYLALVPSEDRPMLIAHYAQAVSDGEAIVDYRLQRPDGSLGWFRQQTRMAALGDNGAELIGTLSDVTKKHALTEQVAMNEARFRGFLEASPDAIIITNEVGQVVMASQRVEAVFGYKPEEIIGKQHGTLVPKRHQKVHVGYVQDFFEAPQVRDMGLGEQVYGLRQDGKEFPAEVRLSPFRNEEGLFVIATVRDISLRIQAQEQSRQAQKMETVGQLAGGIAHDFNNLLTTILGNTELLEWGDSKFDAESTGLIAAIRRAGERAATLTQQLLAFSRKQPLNPAVADLNKVITGMLDMLHRTLGERFVVEVRPGGGLWRTYVDGNQFENAVLNLVINARDAMPNGGQLTIGTSNIRLNDQDVANEGEVLAGDYVEVSVRDTGSGMTEETLQRAFEPFYTTKAIGSGTGLGLSQVYGFVKQSGGHITLSSEAGHGSTVRIYLPGHLTGRNQEVAWVGLPEKVRALGVETVLVVEDDASVRDFSTAALTRLGYRVLAVDTADAALAILDEGLSIDLLFTDIGLPGLDGWELANEARKRWPGLKVLFATGYAGSAITHNQIVEPDAHLLSKPYTIDSLACRVRGILDLR
jgi:PAS domain S-box-containing protein